MKHLRPFAVALLLLAAPAFAEEATTNAAAKLDKQAAILAATDKSLVIVEYTLQYDKGEAPRSAELIHEERPLEVASFLVDATHVVTEDLQIHPRFIKSINVRSYRSAARSEPRVSAKPFAYPREQHSLILELSGTLAGAEPAKFTGKADGPLQVVKLIETEGEWAPHVQGMGADLVVIHGKKQIITEARGLAVDPTGAAVGILPTYGPVFTSGSWKGDPLQWPAIKADEMTRELAKLEERTQRGIVRVMLNFRSPKNVTAEDMYRRGDASATVQNVVGVMLDNKTVLILDELKKPVTARLDRVKIFDGDKAVEAKFKATLTDYGAFVAELEKPLADAPLAVSQQPLEEITWKELPTAEIFMQGEKRITYFQPMRLEGVVIGWRRNLYPEITQENRSNATRGLFVFDPQGALAALPISIRQKASTDDRYGNAPAPQITGIAQVMAAVNDLKNNSDSNNVPLTEDQENRIAFVGFELQPMTQELARANGVSDQTNDGETGAIVSYVYPDSPAGKAGIEPGWVILRINAEGQPTPIDVRVNQDLGADQAFPWDRLDQLPEAYFDRILQYTPWPRAGNSVAKALTEVGFGKKCTIEFFHDGKVEKKEFTVAEGPAHFDNAPRFKHAPTGLTVKDITYEVRRYMQRKPEDPGVIIGKIEVGSRASKAGLKPYEVITHVNDQPVTNVKDFEKLIKDQTELRLNIKRMTHGRIVKIKLDSPASAPATAPAAPVTLPVPDSEQ